MGGHAHGEKGPDKTGMILRITLGTLCPPELIQELLGVLEYLYCAHWGNSFAVRRWQRAADLPMPPRKPRPSACLYRGPDAKAKRMTEPVTGSE
jgi:hypothetical protein